MRLSSPDRSVYIMLPELRRETFAERLPFSTRSRKWGWQLLRIEHKDRCNRVERLTRESNVDAGCGLRNLQRLLRLVCEQVCAGHLARDLFDVETAIGPG